MFHKRDAVYLQYEQNFVSVDVGYVTSSKVDLLLLQYSFLAQYLFSLRLYQTK